MALVFYTLLGESRQLKIPIEFAQMVQKGGGVFSLLYDPVRHAVLLMPSGISWDKQDGDASVLWNYKCASVCHDIMAYVTLPRAVCAYMRWDTGSTLVVSRNSGGLVAQKPHLPLGNISPSDNSAMQFLPKPVRERFVEVYCQKARRAWDKEGALFRTDGERIQNVLEETLIAATKDYHTSIDMEKIGKSSHTAKIANPWESVTCLIKLGDSWEEQAVKVYDTLLNTNIV